MKGSRAYRKSKAMKLKQRKKEAQRGAAATILRDPTLVFRAEAAAAARTQAKACFSCHRVFTHKRCNAVRFSQTESVCIFQRWATREMFSGAKRKGVQHPPQSAFAQTDRLLSRPTRHRSALSSDDCLQGWNAVRADKHQRFSAHTLRDLHIDYAHTIAIGHAKQQYYLIMVVDGVDFMWAAPTKSESSPEELIEDFLRQTRIKIGKLRCDDATVFRSHAFEMWARARDIVLCPTAGYQHTMQARAEGAIRITKEHVRCMIKHSGVPYKFWPWAVIQFCRIYNYWPRNGHAPPWIMLGEHSFSQALHRDLYPFGCYVIGHLSRESPDVPDTTHSDRGLEGCFLGWDVSTPTAWIWSFRKKEAVRMHDPIFYGKLFPFSDPSILLNRDITREEIDAMRRHDPEAGFAVEEELLDDELETEVEEVAILPTPPTQPMPVRSPQKQSPLPTSPRPAHTESEPSGPMLTRRRAAASAKPNVPTPSQRELLEAQTPSDSGESVEDPHQLSQQQREPDIRDSRTWASGADVGRNTPLESESDFTPWNQNKN